MKPKTRDNLIYLVIALTVVAIVLADLLYANVNATQMWLPSNFAFRTVYTTLVLAYFVIRETRRLHATTVIVIEAALIASALHIGVLVLFHGPVEKLPGLAFSVFGVLELFLLFQFVMFVMRYLGVKYRT